MCKSLALALTLVSASICASPVLAEDAPKATEREKEQTAQTPEKETPVPDAPPTEMSQTQPNWLLCVRPTKRAFVWSTGSGTWHLVWRGGRVRAQAFARPESAEERKLVK